MQVSVASRLLPYLLLSFIGVAGWAMDSVALLAVVVIGTVGVAIGSALASRPQMAPQVPADQSPIVKNALSE